MFLKVSNILSAKDVDDVYEILRYKWKDVTKETRLRNILNNITTL